MVSVVRNGKEVSVKHFELVVGDVLKITAGDLIVRKFIFTSFFYKII